MRSGGWRESNGCSILRNHATGVSRGALQDGAEPRQGHDLQLVAQPVHGLRAPLHVLLRPGVRALADRPVGRSLRASIRVKTNVVEVLRRELARKVVATRAGRGRDRDGSVSAGGGPLAADAARIQAFGEFATRSASSPADP